MLLNCRRDDVEEVEEPKCIKRVFKADLLIDDPDTGDDDPDLLIKKKIDVLSWLLYDPAQRDEAIYQTNILVRTLVATEKFEAAKV